MRRIITLTLAAIFTGSWGCSRSYWYIATNGPEGVLDYKDVEMTREEVEQIDYWLKIGSEIELRERRLIILNGKYRGKPISLFRPDLRYGLMYIGGRYYIFRSEDVVEFVDSVRKQSDYVPTELNGWDPIEPIELPIWDD